MLIYCQRTFDRVVIFTDITGLPFKRVAEVGPKRPSPLIGTLISCSQLKKKALSSKRSMRRGAVLTETLICLGSESADEAMTQRA
jgi:hypothetical protein